MQDMTGAALQVGDLLLDERGRIHQVRKNDLSIQAVAIYTNEVHLQRGKLRIVNEGFMRTGFCLKVSYDTASAQLDERIAAYQIAFNQYRAPIIKQEIANHKAAVNAARAKPVNRFEKVEK